MLLTKNKSNELKSENGSDSGKEFKAGKRKRKSKKMKQLPADSGSEGDAQDDNLQGSNDSSVIVTHKTLNSKNSDLTNKPKKKSKKEKKMKSDITLPESKKTKSKKNKNLNTGIEPAAQSSSDKSTKGKRNLTTSDDDSEDESINSDVSEFDMDSYPSDSEEETDKKQEINIKSDESSDESSLSGESTKSNVSEFDMDSYPSDTDDEMEKKRGLPVNAVPSAEVEEKEKRTVFVGNLPYSVERIELKKWFSKFGKVECVRLRSAPIANPEVPRKVAVIKKTFHEARSNIHAYIRFRTVESAENALQANGAVFGDHILRVDRSKHEGNYDPKKAIFIGNVPFSLEENTLRQFFSECGEIESVRIVRDKNTGVGKGFAYVNFNCTSSVPLALKLDGEVLEKRELRVKPVKYMKKNAKPFLRNVNQNFRGNQYPKHFKNKNKTNTSNKFQGKTNKIKTDKFQGEMSKRKTKKLHKKKSSLEKKQEKLSKIFSNKSKKEK